MNKKFIPMLLLFFLLSFSATIQNVNGTWIRYYIGKYLTIEQSAYPLDIGVNQTVHFAFMMHVYKTMWIKTLEIVIEGYRIDDVFYNKTLRNMHVEIPPDVIGRYFEYPVEFTPTKEDYLSCYIHVEYEYNEGNQTIEQEGTFNANAIPVRESTYEDRLVEIGALWRDKYDLNSEIMNLNARISNLENSYSTLQILTYFIAFTTFAFVVTTVYYAKIKKTSKEVK